MADMMIPEGWRISKIGDTCHILDSKRIPLNSQERATRQGAYPYYGANGIQGYIDDFIFEGEHVLLAEDGGYFDEWDSRPISYLVNGKFWVNNHAHILRAKKGHETKYVHYSLVHKNILKHINGGTRAKLNQSDMREIAYLTPPLPEQQKIATILSSVDTVIEKTRAQIDKLKHLKTGMMQQLLTQGIGHTEFKDTPVGRIPKTWEIQNINGLVTKVGSGVTPRGGSAAYVRSGVPLIRSQNVYSDGLRLEDVAYITAEQHNKMANSQLKPNDVLLNITGASIGRCHYLPSDFKEGNVNQHVCIIRPKQNVINSAFLAYLLNSELGQHQIMSLQAGGNREGLNFQQIREISFATPTLPEQHKIVNVLQSIDTKIMTANQKLISVEQTKKALMQDLLTGKKLVESKAN